MTVTQTENNLTSLLSNSPLREWHRVGNESEEERDAGHQEAIARTKAISNERARAKLTAWSRWRRYPRPSLCALYVVLAKTVRVHISTNTRAVLVVMLLPGSSDCSG